ncbi:MAG: TIGR02266 family protein [Thermoanaerobaculia bacterium]
MADVTTPMEAGAERRLHVRIPLETQVRIEYPDFRGFVEEICKNVSIGGMFVECLQPPEPGTRVRFALRLPDPASRIVEGAGEIAWRRHPADSEGPRPGFGVQFTDLAATDQELIFRIVDRYVQRGGTPFDLGTG